MNFHCVNYPITEDVKKSAFSIAKSKRGIWRGENDGNIEDRFSGMIAEYYTHKHFGVDYWFEDKPGFDGGFDLIVNNKRVDVKSSRGYTPPGWWFDAPIIAHQKNYPCDVYLFTYIDKKKSIIHLVGWLYKHQFFDRAEFNDAGDRLARPGGKFMICKYPRYNLRFVNLISILHKW